MSAAKPVVPDACDGRPESRGLQRGESRQRDAAALALPLGICVYAPHERHRLSLPGPRLRHRRHQCPLRRSRPSPARRSGRIVHLITDDYPGLPEAIEAAAPKLGARPRSMIVCGAGPVVGRTLKLTNAPWVMDGPETARRAGLAQGLLLNDFEAQALSLPAIPEDWTRRIGPLPFGGKGPQVILGPGTGLGDRGAGRGGWPLHPGFVGSPPYRLRPGLAGGIRALAASRARARADHQRERAQRGRARPGSPGADDGARPSRSASRTAAGHRGGARRPEGRGGGRVSGSTGGSWRASPATWR